MTDSRIIEEPETQFEGTACLVSGTAVYEAWGDVYYDADLGGSDGWECTRVSFLYLKLDGERLTRDQIAGIIGEAQLKAHEEWLAVRMTDSPSSYGGGGGMTSTQTGETAMERNQRNEAQTKWLAALESGEWKQGHGYLWRLDGSDGKLWCCLGVATALFDPRSTSLNTHPESAWRSHGAYPPDSVGEALCLRSWKGELHHKAPLLHGYLKLAEANDAGATFAEIAAYIRKYPWAVFTNFAVPAEFEDDDSLYCDDDHPRDEDSYE